MDQRFDLLRAYPEDAGLLAPLFDAYRVFYSQASDPEKAKNFCTSV